MPGEHVLVFLSNRIIVSRDQFGRPKTRRRMLWEAFTELSTLLNLRLDSDHGNRVELNI